MRGRLRVTWSAVLVGLLVGCFILIFVAVWLAHARHRPGDTGAPPPHQEVRCLPPGLPADLWEWPILEADTVEMVAATGGDVPLVWITYARSGQTVKVGWVLGNLMIVDLWPTQKDEPAWTNRAFVDDSGRYLSRPAGSCDWRRRGR